MGGYILAFVLGMIAGGVALAVYACMVVDD